MSLRFVLMACCFFGLSVLNAQYSTHPDTLSLEEKIKFLFADFSKYSQVPGTSIMVLRDGEVLFEKAYGIANLSSGTQINQKTNFRLASVTKQFTAMAILLLIEDKKLELDTKLREIFPDFPSYGRNITVQHLLTHTSGLKDYEKLYTKERQASDLDVLNVLKAENELQFEAGSRFKYSNSGYAILSLIVEKRSGMSFGNFLNARIFGPLDMSNSCAYDANKSIKNRAYGYSGSGSKYYKADQNRLSAVLGDGGIYMSTSDYAKWIGALHTEKLISFEMQKKAYEPWDSIHPYPERGYGYGWCISHDGATKIMWHRGASTGFTNMVVHIPEENLTAVILCNRNKGKWVWRLAYALASLYSEYQFKMPIDPLMWQVYQKEGLEAAFDLWDRYKKELPEKYSFHEECLNSLAYRIMDQKKYEDALKVFKKNKDFYPDSWRIENGIGNVYMKKKWYKSALPYFSKAIELIENKPVPSHEDLDALEDIEEKKVKCRRKSK